MSFHLLSPQTVEIRSRLTLDVFEGQGRLQTFGRKPLHSREMGPHRPAGSRP